MALNKKVKAFEMDKKKLNQRLLLKKNAYKPTDQEQLDINHIFSKLEQLR